MKQQLKTVFNPLSITLYVGGFWVVALGVILIIRAELGAGAWDTVTYNLAALLNSTLGTASAIVSSSITLSIIIYRRKLKYLFMIVPIIFVAIAIDFWDLVVFKDFHPEMMFLRLILIVFGLLIIGLGLASTVVSGYPALVFEEWTLVLMDIFKTKNFFVVRIGIEVFAVILATIFGFLAGIQFGAIHFGTLFLALSIGPTIAIFIKLLRSLLHRSVSK